MPIFRSQRQAELLALLFLPPTAELTLTELASHLGVTAGAVHAEVERLIDAGLLIDRFVGRSRLIRANTKARAARALSELLLLSFGPERVVAEEFRELPRTAQVVIYGSWARRYHGQPGPEPADIDVMVIGQPVRDAVYAAADRATHRLGIPVNTTVRSPEAWARDSDALVITAKADAHFVLDTETVMP
jgi:DNA-binding MarR family transcriptional regulator